MEHWWLRVATVFTANRIMTWAWTRCPHLRLLLGAVTPEGLLSSYVFCFHPDDFLHPKPRRGFPKAVRCWERIFPAPRPSPPTEQRRPGELRNSLPLSLWAPAVKARRTLAKNSLDDLGKKRTWNTPVMSPGDKSYAVRLIGTLFLASLCSIDVISSSAFPLPRSWHSFIIVTYCSDIWIAQSRNEIYIYKYLSVTGSYCKKLTLNWLH